MGRAGVWRVNTLRASASRLRVPRMAWICALVALLNGLAWSLITPPFEVPDENAHYAYVQQLAERAALPRHVLPEGRLSPAEDGILSSVDFYQIVGQPLNPAPFSSVQQQAIERVERSPLATKGDGDALSATNNPPLYYAVQAIPYKLVGTSVLDRLAAMRIVSAVMGAITILLVYLFLLELLPSAPGACSVGALVAALQPLYAFMSGGVNNDNLLFLMAAGVLWAIARVFRRGLTPSTGALLGAFLGLGLITKFTLLGFVPACLAAVILQLWREARTAGRPLLRRALRGAALAIALGGLPVAVYAVLNRTVWHRTTIAGGLARVGSSTVGLHFNRLEELSHIWQLFLPNLWMTPQFPSYLPLWRTWFIGLVGRFGWLDYEFPLWMDDAALVLLVLVLVVALVGLAQRRHALSQRVGELIVYALVPVGLCVVIGVQSYSAYVSTGAVFEQPRYLLPLLGLYGALVALAVRGAGRRWGALLGVALVVLALGHDLYGQVLTIARFYT